MGANSLLNTHNICPTTNKMETFWLACFRAFQFPPSLALSLLRLLSRPCAYSLSLSCASCASCAFRNKDLYCCVWQREPESCNRLLACLLVNYSMTSVGVRARGSRLAARKKNGGSGRKAGARLAARGAEKKPRCRSERHVKKSSIIHIHIDIMLNTTSVSLFLQI